MVKESTEAVWIYNEIPIEEHALTRQMTRTECKALGGVRGPEIRIPNQHDLRVIAGAMVDDHIFTVADNNMDPRNVRFEESNHPRE
jgi:hypothetical protein